MGHLGSRTSEETEENREKSISGSRDLRDPRTGARLVCAAGLQLATPTRTLHDPRDPRTGARLVCAAGLQHATTISSNLQPLRDPRAPSARPACFLDDHPLIC